MLCLVLLNLLAASSCSQVFFDPNELATPPPAGSGGGEFQQTATLVPTQLSIPVPITQPTSTPTRQAIQATPTSSPVVGTPKPPILYYAQSGDTMAALSVRFGVQVSEITSPTGDPGKGLVKPGTLLVIPDRVKRDTPSTLLMPDSEIIYSVSALDFDSDVYISKTKGYLTTYKEYLGTGGWHTGAQIVKKAAVENSINPRLLLSLLEYQSHWLNGKPTNLAEWDYPMGYVNFDRKDLYRQMNWAISQLFIGYHGWRQGKITEITFMDGSRKRLAPELNAGTVALMYFFSKVSDPARWSEALYSNNSLPALHEKLFGKYWIRAQSAEPIFPLDTTMPVLELPFVPGRTWSYTGGPHPAWGNDSVYGALDFAPQIQDHGCVPSDQWVTAPAPGIIVRSGNGVVTLDLDGDGIEQTGWVLVFLHIGTNDRIPAGTWVNTNQQIGHPSCEGGVSTGTHFHFARKFNGEWIAADGPLPFILGGWQAHEGTEAYLGTLTNGDLTVTACTCASAETLVTRPPLANQDVKK